MTAAVSPDGLMLASDGNFWMADYTGSSRLRRHHLTFAYRRDVASDVYTFRLIGGGWRLSSRDYPSEAWDVVGIATQYGKASTNHFADGTVFSLNAGLPPR